MLSRRRSSVHDRPAILHFILKSLTEALRGDGPPHRKFICDHDVRSIYNGVQDRDLHIILGSHGSWTEDALELVRKHYLKTLSIMLWINAVDLFYLLFDSISSSGNRKTDSELPYLERDLQNLPANVSHLFQQNQGLLLPFVISASKYHETQIVPDGFRWPFASARKIGGGAYGVVDQTEIPPGYLRNLDGSTWSQPITVACKVFRDNEEFINQARTLQILKESIQSHEHILKHLATITKNSTFIIILPFAEYGDLDKFLYAHEAADGLRHGYSLLDTLGSKPHSQVVPDLLDQASKIASALSFLHSDITVSGNRRIYLAHIDLKPANILITASNNLTVGHWVLSDFGLSAFDMSTQRRDRDLQSIGDTAIHLSRRTIAANPDRASGTYQAPESFADGIVGREGDVFSLGAIISEVLTFATGGASNVAVFKEWRMSSVPIPNDSFFAPTHPGQSEVRPAVIKWLDNLSRKAHVLWVSRCVSIIKRCLVTKPETRLDSTALSDLMGDVHGLFPYEGSNGDCFESVISRFLTETSEHSSIATPTMQNPQQLGTDRPPYELEGTSAGEVSNDAARTDRSRSANSSSITRRPTPPSESTSGLGLPVQRYSSSQRTIPGSLSKDYENDSRDVRGSSGSCLDPKKPRSKAASISSDGRSLVFLTSTAPAGIVIYGSMLDSCRPLYQNFIPLKGSGWDNVVVQGNLVASWGRSISSSQVSIFRVNDLLQLSINMALFSTELSKVIFSSPDLALFCSPQRVLVGKIDNDQSSVRLFCNALSPLATDNHAFYEFSLNEQGTIFYAWSLGEGSVKDALYAWELSAEGLRAHRTVRYPSKPCGEPNIILMPYASTFGCVLSNHSKEFFLAQCPRASHPGNTDPRKYGRKIDHFLTGRCFQDRTLVTVERSRSFRSTASKVKEYELDNSRFIKGEGKEICTLHTKVDPHSAFTVVRDGSNILLLFGNLDWSFEVRKLVPKMTEI